MSTHRGMKIHFLRGQHKPHGQGQYAEGGFFTIKGVGYLALTVALLYGGFLLLSAGPITQ